METKDLIKQAWEAVQAAQVPEHLAEAAFIAAVGHLRDAESGSSSGHSVKRRPDSGAERAGQDESSDDVEDSFFERLAAESGIAEANLRSVFQFKEPDQVLITSPSRLLGKNQAEQARAVIALVAGARHAGLAEKPISGEAVRAEVQRKRCYQRSNYAVHHLGRLKGFNAGANSNELVATAKWIDEFAAAMNSVLGKDGTDG